MIRKIIIGFLLVISCNSLYSLDLAIKPKIGGGFSTFSGIEEIRSMFSFLVGGGIISHFSDRFSAELGLIYQMKGTRGRNLSSTLACLSVPITARVKFVEHLSLLVGPQVSFTLNANTNGVDTRNYTRSTNFDIVFGASYYFLQGKDRLIFEFIVEAGISDLSNANHPFIRENSKNRAGYFIIGWEFSL